MQRRAFVSGLAAVMTAPLTGEAQQKKIVKIGFLGQAAGPSSATQAFRDGLRERGWIEGQNVTIEYRWLGSANTQTAAALAAELVGFGPDIIVAAGNKAVHAAKQATTSVPIVMPFSLDPVGSGLVTSLSRPGQNVTGLTWDSGLEIAGKRLELLKQLAPDVSRVLNIWDPSDPGLARYWPAVMRAAEALSLVAESAEVRSADDVPNALARARQTRAALFLWAGPLLNTQSKAICDFALKHRLPTLSPNNFNISQDGCLIGYAPDSHDLHRRAAIYVDRILRGAKPGDLPIEQPTKFELVINLKTAKAVGLTIPPSLLLRADQVIE
jgi:putative tryptophan/tyrosine transport system substrate-binding protein